MRTRVLDERLEDTFHDWYPDFRTKPEGEIQQAAQAPNFYAPALLTDFLQTR
jgi:hypothetical protein